MAFDVKSALDAGYSLDDIAKYVNFDINAARKAGYNDQQIESFLSQAKPQQSNQPQITQVETNLSNNDIVNIPQQPKIQTNTMDTISTMTPQEMQITKEKPQHSFGEDVWHATKQEFFGAMNTLAGLYGTAADAFGSIPIIKDMGLIKDWQEAAKDAEKFWQVAAKKDNKETGYDDSKELITPYTIGTLIPTLLTLPETAVSRGAIIAMNGTWAAAMTKGEDPDATFGKQTTNALLGAALTGIGYKIGDWLLPSAAEKAVKSLQEKLNLNDKQVEEIAKQYKEVMSDEPQLKDKITSVFNQQNDKPNANEKVKALLYWAGKNRFNIGQKIIGKIAIENPKVATNIEKDILARQKLLKDMANHKYDNLEDVANDLKYVETNIKQDYANIKQRLEGQSTSMPETTKGIIQETTNNIPDELVSSLSDNLRGDLAIIKSICEKENTTNGDLIEAYKSINNLLNSPSAIKTTKGFKLNQIKTQLDGLIKKNLTKEDYELWKQINGNYATMLKVKKSKLGDLINSLIGNGKKSETLTNDAIIAKLPSLVESQEVFKAIRDLIGSEKAAKFENFIIDKLIDKNDGFNWVRLNNMVGKKGFITPEGQQLQNLIAKFADSFKVDGLYNAELKRLEISEGSKTGFDDALKAIGVKYLINKIAKMLPIEGGKEARMMSRITDVLKNPAQVNKINKAMDEMAVTGKQQILNQAYKALTYQPDIETKIKDNAKFYATSQGHIVKQGINTQNRLNKAIVDKALTPSFRKHLEFSDNIMRDLNKRAEIISKHTGLDKDELLNLMLKDLKKDYNGMRKGSISLGSLFDKFFKDDIKTTYNSLMQNDNITSRQLHKAIGKFYNSDNPKINELAEKLMDATDQFTGEPDNYKVQQLLSNYASIFTNPKELESIELAITNILNDSLKKLKINPDIEIKPSTHDLDEMHINLNFNGNKGQIILNYKDKLLRAYTGDLENGSGMGSKFYTTLFDLSKKLKYKYEPDNILSDINTIRLPLNIYKYWKENKYMPLKGGEKKLKSMLKEAIARINVRLQSHYINKSLKNLSDKDIAKLSKETGEDPYLRLNKSLKIFRDIARKIDSGKPLSAIISISLLNAAINELNSSKLQSK